MPTNDFLPWATAGGANVLSQAAYLAEAARLSGVTAGIGKSVLANKSWRQSASMAAMLGQYINDYGALDALDDGDIGNLETNFVRTLQGSKWAYAVATGTANAWVVSPTPALAAYAAGRVLWIKAPATNTATTVNMNVSTLGNRRIKKRDGTDPAVGDLVSGVWYPTIDDGTNVCVVATLPSDVLALISAGQLGLPAGVQVFATPGSFTYTPSAGTRAVLVEVQAGGGGGGGSNYVPGDSTASIGLSGGGGAYARKYLTTGFSGAAVVVGAGGVGGTAGTSGSPAGGAAGGGGTSSFTPTAGSPLTCTGGGGGNGGSVYNSAPSTTNAIGGGVATGGDINIPGGVSQSAIIMGLATGQVLIGASGTSPLGTSPTQYAVSAPGSSGLGKGAGGTGALTYGLNAGNPGGAGAPGVVIVTEFK